MIETRGLDHIHLHVADVERSLRFYRDVFGVTETMRLYDGKMVFVRLPGNGVLTLDETKSRASGVGAGAGIDHFGLGRDDSVDLDQAIREVEAAGGRLLERGEHAPGVAYAYVSDPDGYVIEI